MTTEIEGLSKCSRAITDPGAVFTLGPGSTTKSSVPTSRIPHTSGQHCSEYKQFSLEKLLANRSPFALFTNPPLAGAASLSFQYWERECNCCFFFISTKFNVLIFNTEYAT